MVQMIDKRKRQKENKVLTICTIQTEFSLASYRLKLASYKCRDNLVCEILLIISPIHHTFSLWYTVTVERQLIASYIATVATKKMLVVMYHVHMYVAT